MPQMFHSCTTDVQHVYSRREVRVQQVYSTYTNNRLWQACAAHVVSMDATMDANHQQESNLPLSAHRMFWCLGRIDKETQF